MRGIDVRVCAEGFDSYIELPRIFLEPEEDLFDGVLRRLGKDLQSLSAGLRNPTVEVREWPKDYTKDEALARLLADEEGCEPWRL